MRSIALHCRLILVLVTLTTVGCFCVDPVDDSRYFCLTHVSPQEEAEIGAAYAPNFVAQSGGRYPDDEVFAFLNEIVVDKMARHSQRPDLPWEFQILNTSALNAFALPGGKVFVTRGLLSQVESEAQFAHLMGHEIGHVCHKHALRGQGRNALLGVIVGLIGIAESALPTRGPDDPLIFAPTAGAIGQLATLKFSRDQELQSDERGVDYAIQAGYDPREAPKTFETFLELKESRGERESMLGGMLATHPLDSKRIARIDDYIETLTLPDDLLISSRGWSAIRDKVRGAQEVYNDYDRAMVLVQRARDEENEQLLDEAEQLLRSAVQRLPGHATLHTGLASVSVQRADPRSALRSLDQAVQLQPDLFDARLLRAVVHRDAESYPAAFEDLGQAHQLYPTNPIPTYLLGDVAEKLDRLEEAEQWFSITIDLAPKGSDVRTRARERLESLQ